MVSGRHPKRVNEKLKRIDQAKELLLKGRKPYEVAEELGYASRAILYMAFKNFSSTTIGEFLRENK